jgi:hypothetical protein
MTREQILNSCNTEIGCSCCSPDAEGMFEYLDGAIAEFEIDIRRSDTLAEILRDVK